MNKLAIIAVAVLLSGCAMLETPEQKKARADEQYKKLQHMAQLMEQMDHVTCEGRYGAKRGTPAYTQCRMAQDQQRAMERQAELNRYNQISAAEIANRPRTIQVRSCNPSQEVCF